VGGNDGFVVGWVGWLVGWWVGWLVGCLVGFGRDFYFWEGLLLLLLLVIPKPVPYLVEGSGLSIECLFSS
jgi:hypothetical protein